MGKRRDTLIWLAPLTGAPLVCLLFLGSFPVSLPELFLLALVAESRERAVYDICPICGHSVYSYDDLHQHLWRKCDSICEECKKQLRSRSKR